MGRRGSLYIENSSTAVADEYGNVLINCGVYHRKYIEADIMN